MKLKEAAFIIGSLGGRPRLSLPPMYRSGFISQTGFRLILEDGNGFLLLEDGSYLLLE